MPCVAGIAIAIMAAAGAAAILLVAPGGDWKACRPFIDGELLAPGWGYKLREIDTILTGKVTQRLASRPALPLRNPDDEQPGLVIADYRVDVGRFWYPLAAADRAVAVRVLEPNPEYGDGQTSVVLIHSADLAVGQRALLFLNRIPPDHHVQQAGEFGSAYPSPAGFSYRNHYSVMGVFRYGLECPR